ncbi:MAG: 2-C-methyl-D-erythritol 4-phosphate cytidylyltransferase [candidate division Zixibacteria bacterium]
MKTYALIVAGGSGRRFGGEIPKQYQLVAGKPVMSWTISRFEGASTIDKIVIVVAEEYLLYVNNQIVNPYDFKKVFKIVPGGETRMESVMKGLESLPISAGFVAVHDAVRPLVKSSDIDLAVLEARNNRAAILGRSISETIKRAKDGMIMATVDRDNLYLAETPQVFQYDLLKEAYLKGKEKGIEPTDDASLVESLGFMVKLIPSSAPNPKLTTQDDLEYITMILEGEAGVRL